MEPTSFWQKFLPQELFDYVGTLSVDVEGIEVRGDTVNLESLLDHLRLVRREPRKEQRYFYYILYDINWMKIFFCVEWSQLVSYCLYSYVLQNTTVSFFVRRTYGSMCAVSTMMTLLGSWTCDRFGLRSGKAGLRDESPSRPSWLVCSCTPRGCTHVCWRGNIMTTILRIDS